MGGCTVAGCGNQKVVGRGLCRTHYGRWHRTGSTDGGPRRKKSIDVRFWAKVDKRGPDECWNWLSTRTGGGYGTIGRGGRADGKEMAHRLSYMLHYGEIEQGKWVLHSCDNPACVNPAHLRLGVPVENTRDSVERKRHVPPPAMAGVANAKSKLTEDKVRYIRKHKEIKARFLADKFGVHVSAIFNVLSRRTWKHI